MAGRWSWIGLAAILLLPLLGGCGDLQGAKQQGQTERTASVLSERQKQQIKLLNDAAEVLYQNMQKGNVEDGRVVIQQISDQVTQISFDGVTSIEGMKALTETITQARRVMGAVKFDPDAGQVAAARVRLAADALSHSSQPMWLQFYKPLQDDLDAVEQAAKANDSSALHDAISHLDQHYATVHPSLVIGRPAEDVEKMDSLLAFVKSQVAGPQTSLRNVLNAVPPMRQMLDKLFMKRETTAYLPYPEQQNPILWTMGLGSFILAALGFAGWRLSKKNDGLVPVKRGKESDYWQRS
ncbi:sporulation protein YpjB [Paenibacillus puerhi]|uniref:sporulation protein YpjB n=1 Tax=Paenibacillus puerhi TaxID=2692622 RepID=UPI0013573C36|nr:sporulation protein YpjB [Paenibacillus puerhi]